MPPTATVPPPVDRLNGLYLCALSRIRLMDSGSHDRRRNTECGEPYDAKSHYDKRRGCELYGPEL